MALTGGGAVTAAAPAVVILDVRSVPLARRIASRLPGAVVHGPAARSESVDIGYERLAPHLAALFDAGTPIVGLCTAAILIRILAPRLGDKTVEPPVVAVSQDGLHAVPLLGGHHGANRLAGEIAQALGGRAAITTAGDAALGFSLDAPPPGWHLAPGSRVKAVTAALLGDEAVGLAVEAASADWLTGGGAHFTPLATGPAPPLSVIVTHRRVRPRSGGDGSESCEGYDVVFHPPVLALGLGCERGAAPEELHRLARSTLEGADLAPEAVACVASLDLKADEPAVRAVAEAFGVPVRFFDAATLERETPRLATPSEAVFRAVGCHGVAEAAALACAGIEGALAASKIRSARGTCAVACAPAPIDPALCGAGPGRVVVVGLGPGAPSWRTPAAALALQDATDLVGYRRYLDLLGPPRADCEHHAYPLGAEEARARAALDLASKGRRVALVSSGDAGVYGMASLLFELAACDATQWRRVELAVEPGVSAMAAAAARIGAPLGHDFCAISLSDLLTPWTVIERRLEAAATGDFVVALYNPASGRRRRQFDRARAILAAYRPGPCPAAVARNLGRPDETVSVTALDEIDAGALDMLTLVIVGSSRTRRMEHGGRAWLYTPRGYLDADATSDRPPRASSAR